MGVVRQMRRRLEVRLAAGGSVTGPTGSRERERESRSDTEDRSRATSERIGPKSRQLVG